MDLSRVGVPHHLSPVWPYIAAKLPMEGLIVSINHLLSIFSAGSEDAFERAIVFGTPNEGFRCPHEAH